MAFREETSGLSPGDFARHERAGASLWVRPDLAAAALAAGLDSAVGWESRLVRRSTGRGRTGLLRLGDAGPVARLKRLRRGGLAGPLWRDRFLGLGRVLANLTATAEALRRGVPTPEPLALLAVPGPPGFWRGWLATEEIGGAEPIEGRLGGSSPGALVLEAMRVVRAMHDVGIDHRDLNLGNLLVRSAAAGDEVYVVDLDGARVHGGELRFGLRQAALRRLERSTAKRLGEGIPWYEAYGAGDAALAARLAAGRGLGRMLVALHRIGWRDGR